MDQVRTHRLQNGGRHDQSSAVVKAGASNKGWWLRGRGWGESKAAKFPRIHLVGYLDPPAIAVEPRRRLSLPPGFEVTGTPAAAEEREHLFVPALPRRSQRRNRLPGGGNWHERNWMAPRQTPSMKITLHPKGLSAEGRGGTGILAAVLLMGIALPLGLWLILA